MSKYEVYTQADEPWTTGQKTAYSYAVRQYLMDSNIAIADSDDIDDLLTPDPDYAGMGANAHPDADGPVFTSEIAAKNFAAFVEDNCRQMRAVVIKLAADGPVFSAEAAVRNFAAFVEQYEDNCRQLRMPAAEE